MENIKKFEDIKIKINWAEVKKDEVVISLTTPMPWGWENPKGPQEVECVYKFPIERETWGVFVSLDDPDLRDNKGYDNPFIQENRGAVAEWLTNVFKDTLVGTSPLITVTFGDVPQILEYSSLREALKKAVKDAA